MGKCCHGRRNDRMCAECDDRPYVLNAEIDRLTAERDEHESTRESRLIYRLAVEVRELRKDRERLKWAMSNDAQAYSLDRGDGRVCEVSFRDPADEDGSMPPRIESYDGSTKGMIEIIDAALSSREHKGMSGQDDELARRTMARIDAEGWHAEADAREQFGSQLEASGPVALIDGTEVGPYPAKHSKKASHEEI